MDYEKQYSFTKTFVINSKIDYLLKKIKALGISKSYYVRESIIEKWERDNGVDLDEIRSVPITLPNEFFQFSSVPITLPNEFFQFIRDRHIDVSKFVQEKLGEEMIRRNYSAKV